MPVGKGRHDPECEEILHKYNADAVLLMVWGGEKGGGFSLISTIGPLMDLPKFLRQVADQIEKDTPQALTESTKGSA